MSYKFQKNEYGFTGLEAAIVLIAFVVVAAVFSYVMLGAGFYTTQKSQEVVHTGVTQASSSIAPSGDVIVRGGTGGGAASQITFYITNTAGGTPVDMDKTILTYTDDDDFATEEYVVDTGATPVTKGPVVLPVADWTITNGWVYTGVVATGTADNLLTANEKYKVVVDIAQLTAGSTGAKTLPAINEKFKLELKPPEGAVLVLTRTMPAALVEDNYYPVY